MCESTSPRPAVVVLSVGMEHSLPVECNSLIRDVDVETGLCKDTGTTAFDFQLLDQPNLHLSISSSCDLFQQQP